MIKFIKRILNYLCELFKKNEEKYDPNSIEGMYREVINYTDLELINVIQSVEEKLAKNDIPENSQYFNKLHVILLNEIHYRGLDK